MKKKPNIYTTTEFYRNPHKMIGEVRDGGAVYLGYKNLPTPIAVLINYADLEKLINKTGIEDNKFNKEKIQNLFKDIHSYSKADRLETRQKLLKEVKKHDGNWKNLIKDKKRKDYENIS